MFVALPFIGESANIGEELDIEEIDDGFEDEDELLGVSVGDLNTEYCLARRLKCSAHEPTLYYGKHGRKLWFARMGRTSLKGCPYASEYGYCSGARSIRFAKKLLPRWRRAKIDPDALTTYIRQLQDDLKKTREVVKKLKKGKGSNSQAKAKAKVTPSPVTVSVIVPSPGTNAIATTPNSVVATMPMLPPAPAPIMPAVGMPAPALEPAPTFPGPAIPAAVAGPLAAPESAAAAPATPAAAVPATPAPAA